MHNLLSQAVRDQARPLTAPDGSMLPALTIAQTEQLAVSHGVSSKAVEIAALENEIMPIRYARNQKTLTHEDQIRLLRSRVTIVGLGGLGGAVVEVLARAGVGSLDLADGDIFEDHNLNRQLLSSHERLGGSKVKAARDRIHAINAAVDVTVFDYPMTLENADHMLSASQAAVDCLDNIASRFTLQEAARQANIPLVSAAVAGASGHITTIMPQDLGLTLIYGEPENRQENKGVETTLGCMPQAVMATAAIECSETIKILTGKTAAVLRNQLLVLDLNENLFEVLQLV